MTSVLQRLQETVTETPTNIILSDETSQLSAAQLQAGISTLAARLAQHNIQRLAVYADNGTDWVLLDLACQQANIVLLPIPLFFSQQQIQHALLSAGISHICVGKGLNDALAFLTLSNSAALSGSFQLYPLPRPTSADLPVCTQKITFTSGSSGSPKGVCLSVDQQMTMVEALLQRINHSGLKHLCLLPLSTLLENVAGVYAPLLSSGSVIAPPLASVGLSGSSGLHTPTLLAAIDRIQPNSLILLPQMLQALVMAANTGWQVPASLRFVAVGGAKVAEGLIAAAVAVGIPVFQGYGLSECASVVALTDVSCQMSASVGKPLNHVDVAIEAGEVVVKGNVFLGYVDEPNSWYQQVLHTGDMGKIDLQGLLYLSGRKKNIQVSSFGRNINPEWIESELIAGSIIKQAVIYTEAKPYVVALIEPYSAAINAAEIAGYIAKVNTTLPDYAQLKHWCLLPTPLQQTPQLLTNNGRLKREAFYQHYQHAIAALYSREPQEANNAVF